MAVRSSRGFAFIEILLVGLLAAFLVYKLLDLYFKRAATGGTTQKELAEQGVLLDASPTAGASAVDYQPVLQRVRSQVQAVESKAGDQMKEYLEANY